MAGRNIKTPTDSHNGAAAVLKHTDTVGALPSLETSHRVTAAKKLSHPGPGKVSTNPKINIETSASSSPRLRGTISNLLPCIDGGDGNYRLKKKPSREVGGGGGGGYYEDTEECPDQITCSVTQSLESAVRKLSRTSPNRNEMTGIRAGLAILARGYEQYREGIQLLRPTEFGEASSDDLSSEWESADLDNNNHSGTSSSPSVRKYPLPLPLSPERPVARQKGGLSAWRKVKNVVQWTPFIQTFKARHYPWVQLAGHSGNFKPGQTQGTVLKKLCHQEEEIYKKLMEDDFIKNFVPKYQRTVLMDDDDQFIELEDLLRIFITQFATVLCSAQFWFYLIIYSFFIFILVKPDIRKQYCVKNVFQFFQFVALHHGL